MIRRAQKNAIKTGKRENVTFHDENFKTVRSTPAPASATAEDMAVKEVVRVRLLGV